MTIFFHQFDESFKQIFRVVGTGRGFGMILDGENRQSFVPQSGDRVVIQIKVSYLHIIGQTFRFDGETVIVRSNFNFSGCQILYRLVAAAMSCLLYTSDAADE